MNYTLHQLLIFSKILETKSITKTAQDLHLTQPAVSIQLRNFQDQFDIPLTEIVGRQLFVTEFGNEIGEIAKRIINEIQEIDTKTLSYKGFLTGKLCVSSVSTGKYIIPYFLVDFLKKYPGIQLQLDVTNRKSVLEDIETNSVDFSLVSILPSKLPVFHETLMENKLFLVGNKKASAHYKEFNIKDLENMPIIFREKGSGTRTLMEEFFKSNQLNIKNKIELTSNEAVKQAVLSGLGFSIMPEIGIVNELEQGRIQKITCKGLPIVTNWYIVWNAHKSFSPVAKEYLKFLQANKEDIIKSMYNSESL